MWTRTNLLLLVQVPGRSEQTNNFYFALSYTLSLSFFLSHTHFLSHIRTHKLQQTVIEREKERETAMIFMKYSSLSLSLSYTLCKVSVILVHPRTQKFVVCSLCQTPRLVQHERCLAGLYREELRRLSIKRKCTTTTGGGRIELWRTRKTKNRNENERVLFIPNKMILRPTLALRTWLFWTALGL